ncbi:MAG: TonB-dependent receptor [Chromatiales bacterium]|nr:MAG: TonB-dependent receptor [Chromatiales bacterium]
MAWLLGGALVCAALTQLPTEARAQGAQGGALDDILVTARRREESLQDTPISITAFEGQDLSRRQINKLEGIDQFTPNLVIDTATTFSGANSTASVFIRGIGQVDFTATTEPGVGIYLDGVYISQTIGSVLDLVDVERVEVLRGPQGTLFGRNTIGGAISVTTAKPDTEGIYGDVKVTAGEDSRFDIKGFVNLPITDTLAARLSAAHFERDGYIEAPNSVGGDDLGDIDQDVARAAIRWTPNERFTADFTADWSRARESGAPVVSSTVYDGASLAFIADLANPASPNYVPPPNPLPAPSFVDLNNILATAPICTEGGIAGVDCAAPNPLFGGPTITSADTQPRDSGAQNLTPLDMASDTDVWGVSLTLEYDFDWAVIKSITSYRDVDAFTVLDNDGLLVLNNELIDEFDIDQTTQEFQLTGTLFDERLNWLVGAYFFREDGLNLDQVQFTPVHILSGAEVDNESDAGFAQLTYDFNDKLSFTAGVRYTDETKKFKVGDECRKIPGGPVTRIADGSVVTCTPIQTVIDPKFLNQGFLEFVGAPVFPDDPDPDARVCCLPISDAQGNVVSLVRGLNPGDEVLPRGTSEADFDDWTPLFNISYAWTDDLLTYVSYSEGFKSGGWVQRVFPPKTGVPSFEPEEAKVYEFGIKWSGWDQRLRANAAVFHTDYDDLQIEVNDGIAPVTRNAAEAEIDGFELELTAIPIESLLLQLGVGYLDAEYTELDPREDFFTDLVPFDKDSELVNAPEWSVNASGEYTYNLPNGSRLIARVDYSWVDDHYKGALNFPELEQESYDLWDAYLTWVSSDDVWEASVFGQNLGDEDYIVSGFANALTQGKSQVSIGRPRQVGASLQYRFGDN